MKNKLIRSIHYVGLVAVFLFVEKTRSWNFEHAEVSKSVKINEKTHQHNAKFIKIHLNPLIPPPPSSSVRV